MSIKNFLKNIRGAAKNDISARDEKAESDIASDPHVAGSRAGGGDDGDGDGEYVGRTSPQFDSEVEQSGAEARSEEARGSS